MTPRALDVRAFFPSTEWRRIERLACSEPFSVGWNATHWSDRSLAQAAIELSYVTTIHHATVGRLLVEADLQLHRFRYWKSTVWDEVAVKRARKILWYYERVESLWHRGEVIIAVDEKPNLQVLERAAAKQLMQPGQIERQEFNYHRHGTVNLLVGLTLVNGRMWVECLEKNDGEHFRPAIRRLLHPYGWAKRIHLVMDNGSSHTSTETLAFFRELAPRIHVLYTPTHASWLNPAELLLKAFSTRYLVRGSWSSHSRMIDHIMNSRMEYNQRFAHSFEWEWSCRDFSYWLNNTPSLIRCKTYATSH